MASVLIILLALICTVLPLWMGQRYGCVRLVSPMHLLGYFCLFGFLLKTTVYSVRPDLAFYNRFSLTNGAENEGALYLAVFILLMCLGYRCAVRPAPGHDPTHHIRDIAADIIHQRMLFMTGFAIAGITAVLLLQARGAQVSLGALSRLSVDVLSGLNTAKQVNVNADGVGATLAGIKTFFIVPKVAFVMLLAQGIVLGHRGILLQAAALAGLLVGVALISGDRFELIEMMFFALCTFMLVGGRIGLRSAVIAGSAMLALLAVAAFMTTLRGSHGGLWHQIIGSTYFLDINAAVMITDRMRPDMYLLGESYGWWTFGWVPRAIWIDKPAVDLGVFFKRAVMGLTSNGAFNVTGPGEAYINFGWRGAGMGFVLGWIYRKGEVTLLSLANSLRHASFLLYPLLFYPFVQATLQSSFSAFVVGAIAQLVLILLMIAIFVPRYRLLAPFRKGKLSHVV